jgi:hypothetical protein
MNKATKKWCPWKKILTKAFDYGIVAALKVNVRSIMLYLKPDGIESPQRGRL